PGAYYNYEIAPASILDRVWNIQATCEAHDAKLLEAAFQFPLLHPSVVSVIPGGQAEAEMRSNLAAAKAEIAPAVWSDLKAGGLVRADAPTG
ncbi:MAG: aldo/keto reductase, partial [Pseudomonadota bacterium]